MGRFFVGDQAPLRAARGDQPRGTANVSCERPSLCRSSPGAAGRLQCRQTPQNKEQFCDYVLSGSSGRPGRASALVLTDDKRGGGIEVGRVSPTKKRPPRPVNSPLLLHSGVQKCAVCRTNVMVPLLVCTVGIPCCTCVLDVSIRRFCSNGACKHLHFVF